MGHHTTPSLSLESPVMPRLGGTAEAASLSQHIPRPPQPLPVRDRVKPSTHRELESLSRSTSLNCCRALSQGAPASPPPPRRPSQPPLPPRTRPAPRRQYAGAPRNMINFECTIYLCATKLVPDFHKWPARMWGPIVKLP